MSRKWIKAQWDGTDARWNYLCQWRNARMLAQQMEHDVHADWPSKPDNGCRSLMMRDQPENGWTTEMLHSFWVDRLMCVKYSDWRWWTKHRAEREAGMELVKMFRRSSRLPKPRD